MADIERRAFVKGATLGALAFTVGGSTVMLTARQARAGNVPFRLLKENEAETIESMGETLVPGARTAGIAHFIDQQISVPPERGAAAGAHPQRASRRSPTSIAPRSARSTAAATRPSAASSRMLSPGDKRDFVNLMRQNKADGWQGPPGRSSMPCCAATPSTSCTATMEGYEALGVPYMAHIAPERRW